MNQQDDIDIGEYEQRYNKPWPGQDYMFLGSDQVECNVQTIPWNEQMRNVNYPFLHINPGKFRLTVEQESAPTIFFEIGTITNSKAEHLNSLLKQELIAIFGKCLKPDISKNQQIKNKQQQKNDELIQSEQKASEEQNEDCSKTQYSVEKKIKIFLALKKEALKRIENKKDREGIKEFFKEIKDCQYIFNWFECQIIEDINADFKEIIISTVADNNKSQTSKQTNDEEDGFNFPEQIFNNPQVNLPLTNINLTEPLVDHQKQALTWLLHREGDNRHNIHEQNNSPLWQKMRTKRGEEFYFNPFSGQITQQNESFTGGILADDNGFSQKSTFLALIMSHPCGDNPLPEHQGKTLIVTKNQTKNWKRILKPNMQVISYQKYHDFSKYDVVLATYYQLREDYKNKVKDEKNETINLLNQKWYRAILDQSSSIKDPKTQQAKACLEIKSTYKWCITSQPLIQNSFFDIVTTLQFISQKQMPCFSESWFQQYIKKPYLKSLVKKNLIQEFLKKIIQPLALRRTKESTSSNNQKMIIYPLFEPIQHKINLQGDELHAYQTLDQNTEDKDKKFFTGSIQLRKICDYYKMKEIKRKVEKISGSNLEKLLPDETPEFRKIFCEQVLEKIKNNQSCADCKEANKKLSVLQCQHFLCRKKCLKKYVKDKGQATLQKCPSENCNFHKPRFMSLNYVLSDDWKKTYTPSSKILKIREIVENIPPNEKCVIFTQFLKMLFAIQYDLEQFGSNSIENYTIYGDLAPYDRKIYIKKFNTSNDKKQVLIVSLKANIDMRLPRTKHIILVDPWWNYSVSESAIHSILLNQRGEYQNDEITVHTLICENTVENIILIDNIKKKEWISEKLSEDDKQRRKEFQKFQAQRENLDSD